MWRDIHDGWESVSKHVALVVGDGTRILFWHDKWVGENTLKMLYSQFYVCSNDKDAYISDALCYQEGGNDRFWNVRFYRDFHERELEAAFSFLEFIQSWIPTGVGSDTSHWCLNGNGKFDTRSYYNNIRGASTSNFRGRVFGKLRFLRGWHFLCGQRFMGRFLHWIILCLGGAF